MLIQKKKKRYVFIFAIILISLINTRVCAAKDRFARPVKPGSVPVAKPVHRGKSKSTAPAAMTESMSSASSAEGNISGASEAPASGASANQGESSSEKSEGVSSTPGVRVDEEK